MSNKTEKEVIATTTTAAGIGAAAGAGIAALFAAPLLIPALIGGGVACIAGAIIASTKKD